MATIQDIKSNASLVKNATGIGENTAERVGGVLADMTDYLYEKKDELGTDGNAVMSQKAVKEAITNTVNLTDLDFDLSMIGKIISGSNSCKFVVMQNSKNVGILHCFSDDSQHMLTQVFTTHYIAPFSGGSLTHSDEKIFTYFRSYHLSGGTSDIPQGTWGEWKLVYSSDNNDRLTEVEESSENLSKNVGLDEYETFSDQKEYPAGYTLLKDGLLYTFITDHAAGAWNPEEVEDGSLKKDFGNSIKQNNKVSSSVLITKNDLTEDGWYRENNGEYVDNNASFQRTEITIDSGVKRIIARNTARGLGYAIALFKDDTFIVNIGSVNQIIEFNTEQYDFNKIRMCTKKTDADRFFVLLDYVGSVFTRQASTTFNQTNAVYINLYGYPQYCSNYKISIVENKEYIKPKSFICKINNSNYTSDNGLLEFIDDYTALLYVKEDDYPINSFSIGIGENSQLNSGIVKFKIETIPYDETFLKCFSKISDNTTEINNLSIQINGENEQSYELSGTMNKQTTFGLTFYQIPYSVTNTYKIECISGQELIKPRKLTPIVNGVYYNTKIEYIDDYSGIVRVEESEIPIERFNISIGVVNQIGAGDVTFKLSNYVEGNNGINEKIKNLTDRVESLEDLPKIVPNSPSIHICDTIHCVVGDKVQLYYNMFIHHIGDYSLNIKCSKGKNYPRYWEYTPTSGDVGTTDMLIQLLNIDGSVVEEKSIEIITKSAENPASVKNVLLVGDSLYMGGQIPIELSRRLKGTTGVATSPTSLTLNNYNIVGRLKNSEGTVGWEGTGGWTWSTYAKSGGMAGVRLTVSEVTDIRLNQDCRYKMDDYTQNFYITEINVTDEGGYIFAAFYGRGDIYNDHGLMPQSGTLKRITGEGQEEINFTAAQVESYQPFWNNETDAFDIKSYVDNYCNGQLDILCVQLGINSIIGSNPFTTDFETSVLNEAKKFVDLVHEQLPSTKIYIATLPLPSQNGGIGYNYSASGANGSYLTASWNYKVHKVNDLYRSLMNDENYNTFVSVIDICSEMDSDNNYPYMNKSVNTRSTTTEKIGTNGVHPSNEGYWQIADSWFRTILASE